MGNTIVNIGSAKAVAITFAEKKYYFLYNVAAMMAIQDEFETTDALPALNVVTPIERENVIRVCEILSEQGEAARRHMGLCESAALTRADILAVDTLPIDMIKLYNACTKAANIGLSREVKDDDEEIDLVLLELKKKAAQPVRRFCSWVRSLGSRLPKR